MHRPWLTVAAVNGFLCVSLGAFGAHALKDLMDAPAQQIYDKALIYHMLHTLALALVGLMQQLEPDSSWAMAGWAFLAGVVLFSGSLYLLAVIGSRWLGAITPFGGAAFLWGWAVLAYKSCTRL